MIKNLAEPFEGSQFYPIAEPSHAEPFLSSAEQKKVPSEKYKTIRVQSETIRVLYFSGGTFFCSAELKKGSAREGTAIR